MPTKVTLDLYPNGKEVDQKLYCSMIGSLLYVCASRPNIMLSVGMCARYQAAPKKSHLMAVKRVFLIFDSYPNFWPLVPKGIELRAHWVLGFGLGERQSK
jgi:hypothetical protein